MSYISKAGEENLKKIIEWSKQDDINTIIINDPEALDLFTYLEANTIKLIRDRQDQNAKTWNTIKERRKTNKNYGR